MSWAVNTKTDGPWSGPQIVDEPVELERLLWESLDRGDAVFEAVLLATEHQGKDPDMEIIDVDTGLHWRQNGATYTARTGQRIYQIIQHADRRWQLRVRDRERPIDVPLDDLWITLSYYRSPGIAMIHASCNEDRAA